MSKKEWIDHNDNVIPAAYISAYDKRKEVLVNRMLKEATALNKRLASFKSSVMTASEMLYDLMLKENHIVEAPATKGNWTYYNFNKSVKIEVNVANVVSFDEKIGVAQSLINEFLQEKTAGADADLSALVNNAFSTTKGRLDKARVLSLFTLKIKHPKWEQAMLLIRDSISINSTKRYIKVYHRDGSGEYIPINLNISAI